MHPYIEIIYCLILITLGVILIKRLRVVKNRKNINFYRTFAARKYCELMSRKLTIRLIITVFVLSLVVTSFILIEKGIMSVVWNY